MVEQKICVDIIAPALPPRLDGIGDYSALIAAELARRTDRVARVRVLLPEQAEPPLPLPGVVNVERAFSTERPSTFRNVADRVAESAPDWLLVQYNPFSYGRWGLNPYLPRAIQSAQERSRRNGRSLRVAVMIHEPYVVATDARTAVMATWQRWQLRELGKSADVAFFSTSAVLNHVENWFKTAKCVHLPVGANIPVIPMERADARQRLGIAPEAVVLGMFGTARNGRLLPLYRRAVETTQQTVGPVHFLYIGPDGAVIREALPPDVPVICDGPLSAEEVSRRFAAMDIALAAYDDGVSTRRGGLMAGLAHGVATIGTLGRHTDALFQQANGESMIITPVENIEDFVNGVVTLARDPDLRRRVGDAGRELYLRECDWPVIVDRTLQTFAKAKDAGS